MQGFIITCRFSVVVLDERKFSQQSDCWSFGVLLYEIWTKAETPYKDMHNQKVWSSVQAGYRLPQPPGCPDKIYAIMCECWFILGHRPDFAQLLEVFRYLSKKTAEEAYTASPSGAMVSKNPLMMGKFKASRRLNNAVVPLTPPGAGTNQYADFLGGKASDEVVEGAVIGDERHARLLCLSYENVGVVTIDLVNIILPNYH
jgi:hypothetical protein